MSQAPVAPPSAPAPYRHPLGLPAGSIRALLTMLILGLFWLLLVVPEQPGKTPIRVPLAMYCLLGLVFHFFGAHGHSIPPAAAGEPAPWHLPRGAIRILMVLGTLVVVAYEYWFDFERMVTRLTPPADNAQLEAWPYLLASVTGGFFAGLFLRLGPWKRLAAFQDVLAWISLLSIFLLIAEIVLHVLINPTIAEPINALLFECIMIAVVACYFGARS